MIAGVTEPYFFSPSLLEEIKIPEKGILSIPLYSDDHVKLVLFGFAAGHEMSPHTSLMAGTLNFISGEAELTLGTETRIVRAGGCAQMPPNLTHAITALTPVVMLLTLIKNER